MPSHRPDLHLDWCSHEAARYACERWHYSKCISVGKLVKLGVWEGGDFIGAVVFGRGANNNIGSRYSLRQTEVCELTRIALRGHANSVSRIATIACRMLCNQSPGMRLIVSYADPAREHHGGIYQAMGWLYAGASQAQRELLVNGHFMHKRTATAIWGTASPSRIMGRTRKIIAYGPVEWKHTYLRALDADMRARIAPLAQPYPKRVKQATDGHHPPSGGAAPTHTLHTEAA